ncbi:MAG: hypothetical protein COA54_01130 [Thiotrichaceae bacterium]|nr:MAG: hypothetical protein COA54_01130 [Thiotrichaceae bacterium]
MKKTLLATSLLLAMGTANAGLLTPGASYDIRVNVGVAGGSCFDFGNCDVSGAFTKVTDNNVNVVGNGSSIAGDGFAAVISITANPSGDGFTVNSFNQDAYVLTAGGDFALFANDISGMSGSLDAAGNMTFDATGRLGIAAGFAGSIGVQAWNIDNAVDGDGTNTQDIWTSGTATSNATGANSAFSMTGVPITGSDGAGFTGQLVTAGNIGTGWLFFANTQYSERYDLDIVLSPPAVIPVPAAVWLFGSGLLGLVGVARRRKA